MRPRCSNLLCGAELERSVSIEITYADPSLGVTKTIKFEGCDLACVMAAQAAHSERSALAEEFVLPAEVGWLGMISGKPRAPKGLAS